MKIGLNLTLFLLLFASCRQTDVFGEIEPNTNRVMAEFTDARTGTFVTGDFSPNSTEFDLTEIRIEPRALMDHETKVKVIVNPVVVTQYNAANGTSYTPMPAVAFSLASKEFTFTREKRTDMVRAAIRPAAILDDAYAIGLSIAEVSNGEISSIGKNVIVFVSIKNAYDGIYSIKGYSEIPGSSYNGNFDVPCSEELEVVTASGNSVFLSPAQPVASGNTFLYISNLLPVIQFDQATNKVSGVSASAGGIDLIFPYDTGYDSRYDPATKTIYVKYGVAPAGSGRFVIDTMTYCGPR